MPTPDGTIGAPVPDGDRDDDAAFDELGRRAGAALRRPATDARLNQIVRQGQRHQATTVIIAGGVALAFVVAGVVLLTSDDRHDTISPVVDTVPEPSAPDTVVQTVPDTVPNPSVVEATATTSPPPIGPSAIVNSQIEWTQPAIAGDVDVLSGPSGYLVAGDGPLVAWSVAQDALSELIVSDDSVTWRRVPTSPELDVQSADALAGSVALLGYASSEDGGKILTVKSSGDGGTNWDTIPLPAEVASPAAADRYDLGGASSIALRGDVVVVSIGVEGVSGSQLYVSRAGARFDPAKIGTNSEHPNAVIRLARSGGEFLAMDDGFAGRSTLWHSKNGENWTTVGESPIQNAYGQHKVFGRMGDLLVVAADDIEQGGPGQVWLSRNDRDWSKSDVGGLLDGRQIIAMSRINDDSGITFVARSTATPEDGSITENGVVFVVHNGNLFNVTVYDEATGEVIAEPTDLGGNTSENPLVRYNEAALGYDILDAQGNVRATFTGEDFMAALPSVEFVIIHSDDGIGWSSTSINALIGGKPGWAVWIAALGATTSIAIEETGNQDPPFSDLDVLIGTPRQ